LICRTTQLFSKSLLELLHRKNLLGTECPLLAQSGHALVHRTCPLSGGKADVTRTLICKDPAERICVQLSVELTASVAGGPGCSTETGSDAGKVFFRASSSAFSRRQYSRLPRLFTS